MTSEINTNPLNDPISAIVGTLQKKSLYTTSLAWDFHGLIALPPTENMPQSANITILHKRDT